MVRTALTWSWIFLSLFAGLSETTDTAGSGSPNATSGAAHCATLVSSLTVPNSTVLVVEYHRKGATLELPGLVASCAASLTSPVNATADLCRVVLSVNTTADGSGQALVEGWLPDDWNRRLMGTGGGGISGCVDYATVMYGARLGFAAFGTNGGHNGSSGYELFLDRPAVIDDFGYRAVHVQAEAAKQVVRQHYGGGGAAYSYYVGCSTGGRQGVKEALEYPDDFDGILVGSPGVHWFSIVSTYALLARHAGWPDIDSPAYVRQEQWEAVVQAQIDLLDGLDGVHDGIVDQAYMYTFNPDVLRCGGAVLNDTVCLSPQQVGSVRAVYEPVLNSTGQLAMPAWGLGSATASWSDNVVNDTASLNSIILVGVPFPLFIRARR